MKKLEVLARILSQIHSFSFEPFYKQDEVDIWELLPELTRTKNEVDRKFFKRMAKEYLKFQNSPSHSINDSAIFLSRVHAHTLIPYYLKIEPFKSKSQWDGYHWDLLPFVSRKSEEVDQKFFIEMAKYINELCSK